MQEYNIYTQYFTFAQGLIGFKHSVDPVVLQESFKEYMFEVEFICEGRFTVYYRVPEHYSDIKIEWVGELIKFNTSAGVKVIVVRSNEHRETLQDYYNMRFCIEDDMTTILSRHHKVPYTNEGFSLVKEALEDTLSEYIPREGVDFEVEVPCDGSLGIVVKYKVPTRKVHITGTIEL